MTIKAVKWVVLLVVGCAWTANAIQLMPHAWAIGGYSVANLVTVTASAIIFYFFWAAGERP